MINSSFISKGDGPLSNIGLGFSDQEATIDATAQQELCVTPADFTVIPAEIEKLRYKHT